MNKKFFAALASATMAFTASGSIAVFADGFVEEKTPALEGNDVKPVETKVKWDKEHFGELAYGKGYVTFTGTDFKLDLDQLVGQEVNTADLAKIEKIELNTGWAGEIKGLEYFTGLVVFNDKNGSAITNRALDFSANTKLKTLALRKANGMATLVLPKQFVDEMRPTKVFFSLDVLGQ